MRHLLDLNDLMEEELCHIYHSEQKLLMFLEGLKKGVEYGPLLDWITIYYRQTEKHVVILDGIFHRLFIQMDGDKTYVVENIIKEYVSAVNRTMDESIMEQEAILALFHIIHYKIAAYNNLYIHAKALRIWDEMIELHHTMKEERYMEDNLTFITEEHEIFLNDWYGGLASAK